MELEQNSNVFARHVHRLHVYASCKRKEHCLKLW